MALRTDSVTARLALPAPRRAWLLPVLALHAVVVMWLARQSVVAPETQRPHVGLQAVIVPLSDEPQPPSAQRAPSRAPGKDEARRPRPPLESRPVQDAAAASADLPPMKQAPPEGEDAAAPLDLSYRGSGPREGAAAAADAAQPSARDGESAMARRIEQSARADCRDAYSGLGLLAAPLLLVDAVRKDGCKW